VQPPLRTPRPIERSVRPERPLDYERLSDPILVRRAKDGDPKALEALCTRHAPAVERLARHLLGDTEDARDAAQESLAKLCVRIRQFRGESRFGTWLHRLVVNTCRDIGARQRIRRTEPLDEDGRVSGDADPARAAALSELRRELCAELKEIPKVQARVVILKDALDRSFEAISEHEGMPVGTAKSYAHRARARLRTRLAALEHAVA
jgi:RNA polymerase sigma-70 factor (ECF subfamily)